MPRAIPLVLSGSGLGATKGTMMVSDFGRNLRLLCGQHRSVAEVCRQLGINRQQFNKYLSGATRPSRHNLRRICHYFAIDENQLNLSHARFREAIVVKGSIGARRLAATIGTILRPDPDSNSKLERFLGYYHAYYCSPSFPDRLRRSLVHIYQDLGQTLSKTLDPAVPCDSGQRAKGPIVKFSGVVFYQVERIFILEQDSLMKTFVAETILYPHYRTQPSRLSGITVGVAGKSSREPYASRIVYDPLGIKPDLRTAASDCGVFPASDPGIDSELARVLLSDGKGSPGLLEAVTT